MKINARDFGEIEIDEKDIITFQEPIFGFKDQKKFVLLTEDSIGADFAWLQSIEEESLCFILVNPAIVPIEYNPQLPSGLEETLGGDQQMLWLVVVLKETLESSTVNLKSPIVINPITRLAVQVILDGVYSVRYPLTGREEER